MKALAGKLASIPFSPSDEEVAEAVQHIEQALTHLSFRGHPPQWWVILVRDATRKIAPRLWQWNKVELGERLIRALLRCKWGEGAGLDFGEEVCSLIGLWKDEAGRARLLRVTAEEVRHCFPAVQYVLSHYLHGRGFVAEGGIGVKMAKADPSAQIRFALETFKKGKERWLAVKILEYNQESLTPELIRSLLSKENDPARARILGFLLSSCLRELERGGQYCCSGPAGSASA